MSVEVVGSSSISEDDEAVDLGVGEGQSHGGTSGEEGSPSGRRQPPFLNLNLDHDSGVDIPPPGMSLIVFEPEVHVDSVIYIIPFFLHSTYPINAKRI